VPWDAIILIVVFRRQIVELLSGQPRSASSLAAEMGLRRGDIEEDLRHALRSARAAGHRIVIVPARCKDCDFVFGEERVTKPGRCPVCKGSRLFEPLIGLGDTPAP
jgi:predicted Zn-ribbon and HTH transcriptional regulator